MLLSHLSCVMYVLDGMLLPHVSFVCPGWYAIVSRSHLSFVCPGWYAIVSPKFNMSWTV
jgi:hypothetical protein